MYGLKYNLYVVTAFFKNRVKNYKNITMRKKNGEQERKSLTVYIYIWMLILAGSDGLSLLLVGHSLETRLDGCNRASRVTLLTLEEIKSSIFLKDCVRGPASVAGNVFLDISPKNIFNLFLLESAFNDQLIITVNTSRGT